MVQCCTIQLATVVNLGRVYDYSSGKLAQKYLRVKQPRMHTHKHLHLHPSPVISLYNDLLNDTPDKSDVTFSFAAQRLGRLKVKINEINQIN